jgi:hypothetical protein
MATEAARSIGVKTPLGEDALLLRSMTGTEQLGRLFQYELLVLSKDEAIKMDDILGQRVTVRLDLEGDKKRFFDGFVSRFAQAGTVGSQAAYRAQIVPWLWFLTRTSDCWIFQNKTVPDIVKQIDKGEIPKNKADVQGLLCGVAQFDWNSSRSTIRPGAICENLTSFSGVFTPGFPQTTLAEFMRNGATGSSGTVAEPYAIQNKFPYASVQVHYARGCSLAEAFYQSISGPYQLLIVGDPLSRPWANIAKVQVDGVTAGEKVSGNFHVLFLNGDHAGAKRCPVELKGYDLTALLFARDISDPLIALVRKIDRQLDKAPARGPDKNRRGVFVVFTSDDPALKRWLQELIVKEKLKHVLLCFGTDKALEKYEIAEESAQTVVIYQDRLVKANHAFRKGELDTGWADVILKALAEVAAPEKAPLQHQGCELGVAAAFDGHGERRAEQCKSHVVQSGRPRDRDGLVGLGRARRRLRQCRESGA